MKLNRVILFLALGLVLAGHAKAAAQVPAEFNDLYVELYNDETDFRRTVTQSWDRSKFPVAFSANLLSANAELGPALLAPGYMDAVRQELDGLKALGVTAILLDIDFPVLYRPFHASAQEQAQYISFYVAVAQEVRSRGMKLVVETQSIFTHQGFTNWNVAPYYAGLSLAEYQFGRMDVARTILLSLRPDYLSVIQEPDTEATQTGKPELGTVDGSAALLRTIVAGLQAAGLQGVKIGAGVGTWQAGYADFIGRYAADAIDFVDMHVYPVNRDFLARAIEIADIAHTRGKDVGITETWLYKVRENELSILDYPTIFERDVFDFWAPLDALHLQAITELAHFKHMAFVSPFWTGFFRAYLPYTAETAALPAAEAKLRVESAQRDNIGTGVYSKSGYAYKNAILATPDVTPPSAVADLTAHMTTSTSLVLTWSPAADNVGTAFYRVFRGVTQIAQTAVPYCNDSGLTEARDYQYSVIAFDASGNRGATVTIAVRTPDMTPPSMPANLAGTATVSGSQINLTLSWSPASDNVGVQQYRIYRGSSPDSLSIIALSAVNSFVLSNVPPATTYYFAVSALDATYNASPITTPIRIITPNIPDITKPTVSVTYPTPSLTISRVTYLYGLAYDVRGGLYDQPSGVASLQFRIDGVNVGSEQTVPYITDPQYSVYRIQFDTRTLKNGLHSITAVARDRAGNIAVSAPVTVTVTN